MTTLEAKKPRAVPGVVRRAEPTIESDVYNATQLELLRTQIIGNNPSDAQVELFIQQCVRTGLDPFSRQIYGHIQGGNLVTQVAIDGFRSIAASSGRYNGQAPIEWYDGTRWVDVWPKKSERPVAARASVYMKGADYPTPATVSWDEFGGSSAFWKKYPAHMLAKIAEAHALRKAFPRQLSGIYEVDEEIHDFDEPGALDEPSTAALPVASPTPALPAAGDDAETAEDLLDLLQVACQSAGKKGKDVTAAANEILAANELEQVRTVKGLVEQYPSLVVHIVAQMEGGKWPPADPFGLSDS